MIYHRANLAEVGDDEVSFDSLREGLDFKLPEPRVAHDAAAPAPDVEPQALEAEEGVTIEWEVSRG